MKKFQNLGRSLTKEQQKKIKGGDEMFDPGGDGAVNCGDHYCNQGCPSGCKCQIACTRCAKK
jgi:hypothetical protein